MADNSDQKPPIPMPYPIKKKTAKRGFTLVELLVVIAIIGILAAILLPVLGLVGDRARLAQTRAKFNQWSMALENYRSTYGFYPPAIIPEGNAGTPVSMNTLEASQNFVRALSGRNLNGSPLSADDRRTHNRNQIEFYSFTDDDFLRDVGGEPLPEGDTRLRLADAFNNPNIFIQYDRNGNGRVEGAPRGTLSHDPLRQRLIIYSLQSPATPGSRDVGSWD